MSPVLNLKGAKAFYEACEMVGIVGQLNILDLLMIGRGTKNLWLILHSVESRLLFQALNPYNLTKPKYDSSVLFYTVNRYCGNNVASIAWLDTAIALGELYELRKKFKSTNKSTASQGTSNTTTSGSSCTSPEPHEESTAV